MVTMNENDFGLYGILTNPKVGYEQLAEIMVEKGIRFIQLRMKDTEPPVVEKVALAVRRIVPRGIAFIVNDDPRIAAHVGADGVHLGQSDMSMDEARAIVGPDAIIGLSTHNPAQTAQACALHPDYIGVGPVYATPTKKNPDPVIGIDGMRAMLEIATVPAVVLGGIDHGNLPEVLKGGGRNICAVRCINGSSDPGTEIDRMVDVISMLNT